MFEPAGAGARPAAMTTADLCALVDRLAGLEAHVNDTVDNSAESCPDPSDIVPRWGPHNHVDPEPWAEEENALTELVNELGVDELGIDELGMDERGVDLDTWTEAIAMLAKERAA
jgi:hypothetical protein